jgi:hypothetical protein
VLAGNAGLNVVLAEKNDYIGGRLHLASQVSTQIHWHKLLTFYERTLHRLGNVELRLSTRVKPYEVSRFEFCIYAGGRTFSPSEASSPSTVRVLNCDEAWGHLDQMRNHFIVIVDEHPYQGTLYLAEEISNRGATILVVSVNEHIGKGLDQSTLTARFGRLRTAKVTLLPFTEIARINSQSVTLRCLCSGQESEVSCAYLVLGSPPLEDDAAAFGRRNILRIGDVVFPRGVEYALRDAADAIHKITNSKKP